MVLNDTDKTRSSLAKGTNGQLGPPWFNQTEALSTPLH